DHGVSAFGVGDVDGDSKREIVWGTGLSSSGADELVVAGLNPGIEVEWTNADPVQLDGPFVGGALARSPTDAPAPLFVTMTTESGYAGSRALRLDPVDGTLAISPEFDMTGSRFSIAAIDDYDSDGTDEALLASIGPWSTTPTVYDFYADSVEWQPPQFESAVQLASGNLTGDSRDELVWISWDGFVSVLDVATQQITRQSDALPGARGLRVADRDGNGIAEVYAITPSSLHHFYPLAAGSELVHYEAFPMAGNVLDVVVGDINGDGRSETFVLVDPHDPNGGSVVVPFDSELRPNPPFTLPWRARSIAIEPSPFGRKNLLVSRTEGNLPAGRLVTVDAQNGSVVSESPPLIGAIARDSVHYVDLGSSQPRISIGTDAGMYLTR
ncbi:MAG TPA: VCBS repeat-containing protein, partial [Gammaproteobacteria bacterium]|nr:VCBS repeat-containing protein [Gammaproteobacteria bacterium]